MACSRFLCKTLIFCGTFLLLNAFFKEQNDINEIIGILRAINSTPPLVIERLESALANGKTMYTPDELSELFEQVFEGVKNPEEQTGENDNYEEENDSDDKENDNDEKENDSDEKENDSDEKENDIDEKENDSDEEGELDIADDDNNDLFDENESFMQFDFSQSEEWEEEELPKKGEEDKFEGENASVKEEL